MLYVKHAVPSSESIFDIENSQILKSLFNDAPDAIFLLDAKNYSIILNTLRASSSVPFLALATRNLPRLSVVISSALESSLR